MYLHAPYDVPILFFFPSRFFSRQSNLPKTDLNLMISLGNMQDQHTVVMVLVKNPSMDPCRCEDNKK